MNIKVMSFNDIAQMALKKNPSLRGKELIEGAFTELYSKYVVIDKIERKGEHYYICEALKKKD